MNWNNNKNNRLVKAVLSLKDPNDVKNFLRDLMTEKEINEFANRLEVAKMLSENISYTIIEKKTGLSSTTIARVSKWLNSSEGGYRNILNKLHHSNSIQIRRGLS
ncbi:MAG: YerC/YecD family TrpR-related protein [Chthoniobacterales bacterium]